MATLFALSVLASEEGGHGFTRPLPMSPIVYGALGVAVVLLALLFLWFFRRSAGEPVDRQAGHAGHAGHGGRDAQGDTFGSERDRDHQAQQSHRGKH